MKRPFVIAIVFVIIAAILAGGYVLCQMTSPQYALSQTIKDVRKNGTDALQSHLTADAWEDVQQLLEMADTPIVSGILSIVTQTDGITVLKSKLAETEWSIDDVLKSKKRADVVIGFNYEDTVVGTIELTMIREGYEWKIDSVSLPSFDKIASEPNS